LTGRGRLTFSFLKDIQIALSACNEKKRFIRTSFVRCKVFIIENGG
jgi:hypothetical protein